MFLLCRPIRGRLYHHVSRGRCASHFDESWTDPNLDSQAQAMADSQRETPLYALPGRRVLRFCSWSSRAQHPGRPMRARRNCMEFSGSPFRLRRPWSGSSVRHLYLHLFVRRRKCRSLMLPATSFTTSAGRRCAIDSPQCLRRLPFSHVYDHGLACANSTAATAGFAEAEY